MRFIFNEDQILRLKHRLSKEKINEDVLDDLISKGSNLIDKGVNAAKDFISGLDTDVEKKSTDVPAKADFIGDNVDDFYKILDGIDKPIKQQKYGSMTHQQSVEAIQIALQILGYALPRFGTDGLFGPETATAVNKYKQDKGIEDSDDTSEDLQEATNMIAPLPITAGKSYRWNEQRKSGRHKGIDIPTPVGTPIKCIADGKVIAAGSLDRRCGDGISVQHADGFVSSYCHLSDIKVSNGQTVSQGDVIALSGGAEGAPGSGNSGGPHLHLTLKKDGNRVNPLEYFGSSIGTFYDDGKTVDAVGGAVATPEMVKELISDLKSKNITSEDIKKHIDPAVSTGGSVDFTDLDLSTNEGIDAYEKICDNYIKQRNPNAAVTGAMMADAAKRAYQRYRKYIPPELALSQLTLEGGISKDTSNRPIRTKNPFNVGNTPTSSNPRPTFEDGVNLYYDLIARRYLVNGKTAKDLINDFKNDNGHAYADVGYETKLRDLVKDIRRKSEPIYASIKSKQQTTLSEELLNEADKRQAIKNVFGFSDDWANEFHNLNDKISIWIASTFLDKLVEQYRSRIPQGEDPKRYIVRGLNDGGPRATSDWRSNYRDKYEYILHWFRAPRREQINIRELSLDDAYALAEEWHDTLQVRKQADYNERGDVFIDYRNSNGVGYYWVNLQTNYCSEEQERMGHCARANTHGSKLISLRRINEFGEGESLLTVDYRPGGIIGDFHRHGNKKPTSRFHKQIVDLLTNTTYPVTQLTSQGVHRYDENFHLADLSPENLQRVYQNNPALRFNINDESTWPEIINAILNDELNFNSYSNEIKAELLKTAANNGLGEQFAEKFNNRTIFSIVDDFRRIDRETRRVFMSFFGAKMNAALINQIDNKQPEQLKEFFTDSLKEISQDLFDYYNMFCEYIDHGFRKFNEGDRVDIIASKGIKRTLFSCTDMVPFLSRYVENSPIDRNGNIAVKTEENLWGLIKQNGEIILHPQFAAVGPNMLDKSGKTYLVKNLQGVFFKYNYETGDYTKFTMKS